MIRKMLRKTRFILALLLCLFLALPGIGQASGSDGQDKNKNKNKKEKKSSGNKKGWKNKEGIRWDIGNVLVSIREMYLDHFPAMKRIKTMREQGANVSDRVQEIKTDLEGRIADAERNIQQLDPKNRRERDYVKDLKKIFRLFRDLQEKLLNGWSPGRKERARAARLSKRERLEEGLARPSLVRAKFLAELTEKLRRFGRFNTTNKLGEYQYELKKMYWRVLDKYMSLLKKVREARIPETDGEEDGEGNESGSSTGEETAADTGESSSSAQQGKDGSKKKKNKLLPMSHKKVQKTLEEVRSSWNEFWSDLDDQLQKTAKKMNRVLLLFRDRKYINRFSAYYKHRTIDLKSMYMDLKKFRRDGIFDDPETSRKIMLMMARTNVQHVTTVLSDELESIKKGYARTQEIKQRLMNVKNAKQFSKKKDTFRESAKRVGKATEAFSSKFKNQINQIKIKPLKRIGRRLKERTSEQDKEYGRKIQEIAGFASRIESFLNFMRNFPRTMEKFLRNAKFKSKKQFKKLVKKKFGSKGAEGERDSNKKLKEFSVIERYVEEIKNLKISWDDEQN